MKLFSLLTEPAPMNPGTLGIVMAIAGLISVTVSELIWTYGGFSPVYAWDIIACILAFCGILFMLTLKRKRHIYKHEVAYAAIYAIPTIAAMTGISVLASHYLKPPLVQWLRQTFA